MNNKMVKFSIYGRASTIKQTIASNDLQALRYYNYLLMIQHYHKTNTNPHANKFLKPVAQQMPEIPTNKEFDKNHAWSFPVPHWIVEIFTREKVDSEILRNTA